MKVAERIEYGKLREQSRAEIETKNEEKRVSEQRLVVLKREIRGLERIEAGVQVCLSGGGYKLGITDAVMQLLRWIRRRL